MLTGFQQLLAACIGKTEEENDQSTDAHNGDKQQSGGSCLGVSPETPPTPEATTDDSPVDDAERTASSTTDTEVSGSTEPEENDVSAPEETHPEADASPGAADETPQADPDDEPLPLGEDTGADDDNVPVEPSVEEGPAEGDDTPQSLEPTDSVPEDEAESSVEIAPPPEESETDSQATEVETQETDENADTETEPEEVREPVPVDLGIVEEIYDFVEMFEHSTISGTEQASANGRDCSGGVIRPAIFEHPPPIEVATIDYALSLPDVDSNDKLLLHFFIGLRDGVVFDDAERQPAGGPVRYRNLSYRRIGCTRKTF